MNSQQRLGAIWLVCGAVTCNFGIAIAFAGGLLYAAAWIGTSYSESTEPSQAIIVIAYSVAAVGAVVMAGSVALGALGVVNLIPQRTAAGHPLAWIAVAVPMLAFGCLFPLSGFNPLWALFPLFPWLAATLFVAAIARVIRRHIRKGAMPPPPAYLYPPWPPPTR